MKLRDMLPYRTLVYSLALMSVTVRGDDPDGLFQSYCSTQNTGIDSGASFSIYMSNGNCQTRCQSSYAFAIVQYQQCWCSNIAPGSLVDVDNCNQPCPGYQSDLCGNLNTGLFGYIALSREPSGTAGASSSQSTSASSSPSSSSSQAPSSASTSSPESSTGQTLSSKAVTVTPIPATSTQASTSIQVITVSGAVVTQYVTSTPAASSGSAGGDVQPIQRKSGVSAGAIAGIVIGILAGFTILALAAFLLWRRRRKSADADGTAAGQNTQRGSPSRNISVLSKSGLIGRSRPETAERDDDPWTAATGNNSVRHSILFGQGAEVSPTSPLGSSHDGDSRRHSKPFVYDQRLNPSALYANQEGNNSRVSMQDTQDYSRPLGVANPDPRASFDSRISRHG